jgi:predicted Zn finger-like uncharacterized protein
MSEIVECPKCGSIYELTKHHSPSRDKDTIECEVCGETIKSWNGGEFYTWELKKKGEKKSQT